VLTLPVCLSQEFRSHQFLTARDLCSSVCLSQEFRSLPSAEQTSSGTSNIMLAMWRYFWGTPGQSGFGSASTAEDVSEGLNLNDHTAIVTGGTAGIGLETARVLAKRGARVILAIRNLKLGESVKSQIVEELGEKARVLVMHLDLSDLKSVRKFAAEYKDLKLPLNILVNNGGITSIKAPSNNPDGLELMFATNYLGHYLLTDLLLDTMKTSAKESGIEGRIVLVSGASYKFTPKEGIQFDKLVNTKEIWGFSGYGQSNLARVLHCRDLAARLKEEGVNITVNTLHPGAIRTKLTYLDGFLGLISGLTPSFFFKNPAQGAATQVYVGANAQLHGVSGKYFMDCNEHPLEGKALDSNLQKKLIKWTEDYINSH